MRWRHWLFSLSLFSLPLFAETAAKEEFVIQLKDPIYVQGVLRTDQGGVVTAKDLRIQAQKIEYTNHLENGVLVQTILAEGDLMMEYQGRFFVADKLEFDLINNTGTLYNGKTAMEVWFIGGEKIELKSDGTCVVYGGYLTTSESQDHTWEIKMDRAKLMKGYLLAAKNIRFRFMKLPIFWLPSIKSNLKFFKDPPIRYKILWDRKLGPRLSMRYRIYSWETFNAYLRFDYRIKLGPGAALETDYVSKDNRTIFQTKTYGAYDKSVPNEKGRKRYRIQGLFHTATEDAKNQMHLQWDRLSDDRMINDFKSEDFEINTQKRTYLLLSHQNTRAFGLFNVQPRINYFQSMNQELPYFVAGVHPFTLGRSGIVSENIISSGYLDYTFASEIDRILHDRKAGRIETRNQLYRPIFLKALTITPMAGITGIYYSNSPERDAAGQFTFRYGLDVSSSVSRLFGDLKHLLQAYASFRGNTSPLVAVDRYFVFDLDDGIAKQNWLRFGVRNSLYPVRECSLTPKIESDLYTYAFWGADSFSYRFPKLFLNLAFNYPTFAIKGATAWNFQQNLLDFINLRFLWTVSDSLAFGLEMRHRSKYDWRKADHENFTVDFARPLSELLSSPMSDKRNTVLAHAHMRFSPRWSMHIEYRHGWGRSGERDYNQLKVDLYTMLTYSYQLRLTYKLTPNNWEIAPHFNLIK